MKKILYTAVAVIGMYGVSEGMNEQRGEQETFWNCCRAVAMGNEESGNKSFEELKQLLIPCESLVHWLQPYCNNRNIDYLQFKLHQAEILVYLSLMNYAIANNYLSNQAWKGRFIHWYNKQSRLIKSWS